MTRSNDRSRRSIVTLAGAVTGAVLVSGCGWIEDDEPSPGDEGISGDEGDEADDQPPPDDEGSGEEIANESDTDE